MAKKSLPKQITSFNTAQIRIVVNPGDRFARLTFVREIGQVDQKRQALFLCDCGNELITELHRVRYGGTRSCGCLISEHIASVNASHGASRGRKVTPEYRAWRGMRTRCNNPNEPGYKNYGGRGIRVCDRWQHSFENFLADMGKRPSPTHSIDRFPDNNGNYEPGNCRWATRKEQAANRRAPQKRK